MTKPLEDSKITERVTPDSGVDQQENGTAVDATTADIRQQLIVVIQADFGEISRRAFELRNKGRDARGDAMKSLRYSAALDDLRFDEEGKFVWYDGREGYMPEVPIGKPDDYLEIREDYGALKEFIGRIVDKGRVHAWGGTHGDSSRETNCADYVTWLHRHNNNEAFRRNVERAVLELLGQEFDRDYTPLDVDTELQRAETYGGPFFHRVGDIHNALSSVGLEHNVHSTEDRNFRDLFVAEMEKTARPMTEEEYVNGYAGSEQKKRKDFATGRAPKKQVVHYEETSPEFKAALKNWLLKKQAKEVAVRKFSPQFNRLIGLLNVVAYIGKHNPRFSEVAALLKQKAEEKFMIDAPGITHHYSATDIYKSILAALSSVQQGDELHQFWLDNIENDPSSERVIASVHGLLTTSESQEERRRQLPALLSRLKQREYDMDTEYKRFDAIGFYFDENFLNDVLRHVTRLCYPRNTFHHLDKNAGTLDFLEGKDVKLGGYDFRIERFTPEEQQKLCASFDVAGDSISGNTELEPTVRAYLDRYGYELPNGVDVTSLEGRKIIRGDRTKVVKTGETSMKGVYEGFIGLNHTHFAFIYDAATGIVRIAKPTDSRIVMFGVPEGWTQRRRGLDEVKSKIPYEEFQNLTTIGQQVNAIIADSRANRIGDSLFSLDGKLSEEIAPYLSSIIQGRLIQNADGLVQ